MKETKEEKPVVEENVGYDDRRKELTHTTKETKPSEFGRLELNSKAILHEKGIRKTVASLEKTRKILKENVEMLNKRLGQTPKMNPELQKLKENLMILEKIRHDEIQTEENKMKEEADLMKNQTELKKVEKDLKQIKEVIGTRLNFKEVKNDKN